MESSTKDKHLEESLCYLFSERAPRDPSLKAPKKVRKSDCSWRHCQLWSVHGLKNVVRDTVPIADLRDPRKPNRTDQASKDNFRLNHLSKFAKLWREANGVFSHPRYSKLPTTDAALQVAAKLTDDQWFFGVIGAIGEEVKTMIPPIDETLMDEQKQALPAERPVYPLPEPKDVDISYRRALKQQHGRELPSFEVWQSGYYARRQVAETKATETSPSNASRADVPHAGLMGSRHNDGMIAKEMIVIPDSDGEDEVMSDSIEQATRERLYPSPPIAGSRQSSQRAYTTSSLGHDETKAREVPIPVSTVESQSMLSEIQRGKQRKLSLSVQEEPPSKRILLEEFRSDDGQDNRDNDVEVPSPQYMDTTHARVATPPMQTFADSARGSLQPQTPAETAVQQEKLTPSTAFFPSLQPYKSSFFNEADILNWGATNPASRNKGFNIPTQIEGLGEVVAAHLKMMEQTEMVYGNGCECSYNDGMYEMKITLHKTSSC